MSKPPLKIHPISQHEGHIMLCPVCRAGLSVFHYNHTEIDICTANACGIWFDYGETEAIISTSNQEAVSDEALGTKSSLPIKLSVEDQMEAPVRNNPRTGKPLQRYEWNKSGIVLDRCPETGGIWMDSHEIKQYADFIKKFRKIKTQTAFTKSEDEKLEEALNKVAGDYVKWDFGLLDDVIRSAIKGFGKGAATLLL